MKSLSFVLTGVAAAALLAASSARATGGDPAPAAKTAGSSLSGVTVTPAPKANPLVDPTTQYVREHLPEGPHALQFPRFHDEICVQVQGLPAEFDAFVAKRIVELAAEVRAPVAKAADCTPNVNVIFSAHPQAQLSDIAKRRDILIGYQFMPQLQRLSKVTRPIEARYVTRTVGDNGRSQLDVWDPDRFDPAQNKEPPSGRAGSRLANGMSAEIVHSLILADANKVADEKIGAVADYVAVLALARWQGLARCNAIPTILNLMADGCDREGAPQAATPQDIALLSGLYSVDPREFGTQQRASIASAIRKASAAEAH
ncbi:hypothetical protein [Phenylobacterium sp.]|uniref:hypothetical protein n=1 Tax=Phenylobacterium sp. TaxID=1871053 RepID=UPI002B86F4D8|nr:hypothetical protein [Phenylobacterium sp.]HLZ75238.1 hypothetical protein [Phenylobacterium sp.]